MSIPKKLKKKLIQYKTMVSLSKLSEILMIKLKNRSAKEIRKTILFLKNLANPTILKLYNIALTKALL
jgi:hypothetical protein